MTCPNCEASLTTSHIRENPECDRYIASLAAIRSVSKRMHPGKNGGRPVLAPKPAPRAARG